ncbi:MAG: hypothetical protein JXK93_05945 [Sphaerochaetaceae bacterium]|nr:hypothetical protein [Sphaerochaetaceae bacterium]
MKKIPLIAAAIILIFTLSGCVMQQGISLTSTQSGWATTDLSVYDFFVRVLEDFEPFDPDLEEKPILETAVEDFVTELDAAQSTDFVDAMQINDTNYFIDFTFSSLQELLKDLNDREEQSLLTITKKGSRTRMSFYLDLDNYPELERIVPFMADENFETFGPRYNVGMSEAEYLEMIMYILGEEGPPAIDESVISLRLNTPGRILASEGGVMESSNTIRFDIPLIDILLLGEPVSFYAEW